MSKVFFKNIEYLPSQLHFNIDTDVDLEDLLPRAADLFPDAKKIEIRGQTLYLYDPTKIIEFIHISQHKVGIVLLPEMINTDDIEESVWKDIEKLMDDLNVLKLTKFNWVIKVVYPFKMKEGQGQVASKLSPVEGYEASALTLYPKEKKGYHIHLSMVTKDESKSGLLVSFAYEIATIQKVDVLSKIKNFKRDFNESNDVHTVVEGILKA